MTQSPSRAALRRLCVFCGSHPGNNPAYAAVVRRLGVALAAENIDLVYGAGGVGLMGILADAVLAAGGRVVGVIPELLATTELMHKGLTDVHVVSTMHQRKALMAELADGFLALPGGLGTLEEVLEAMTWVQLRIQDKPVGLLNVGRFFSPLIAQLELCVSEGFLASHHLGRLLVDSDPHTLLGRIQAAQVASIMPSPAPRRIST